MEGGSERGKEREGAREEERDGGTEGRRSTGELHVGRHCRETRMRPSGVSPLVT